MVTFFTTMGQLWGTGEGRGFYVHKEYTKQIVEFKGIHERIAMLKMRINDKKRIAIFQIYAPTLAAKKEKIKEFYKTLEDCCTTEKEHRNIIMGDFNAKIGNEQIVGIYAGPAAIGPTNKNGFRMAKFAMKNNLKIANTFFNKKISRKWTWGSLGGRTKNEIDPVLTDKLDMIKDVGVLSTFLFSSDHRPVRCKIRYDRFTLPNRKITKNVESKNSGSLWIPVHRRPEAEHKLEEKLNLVDWEKTNLANLQENYDYLEKILNVIIREFGTNKKQIKTDDKLSPRTKSLIKKRMEITKKITLSVKEQIELIELRKLIKKKIKENLTRFEEEIAENIGESTWSTKQANRALTRGRFLFPKIRNNQCSLIFDRGKIIETAKDFFKELYSDKRLKGNGPAELNEILCNNDDPPLITKTEVAQTLKSLKPGRAPGPDGIINEHQKEFKKVLTTPVAKLFNVTLSSGLLPKQ